MSLQKASRRLGYRWRQKKKYEEPRSSDEALVLQISGSVYQALRLPMLGEAQQLLGRLASRHVTVSSMGSSTESDSPALVVDHMEQRLKSLELAVADYESAVVEIEKIQQDHEDALDCIDQCLGSMVAPPPRAHSDAIQYDNVEMVHGAGFGEQLEVGLRKHGLLLEEGRADNPTVTDLHRSFGDHDVQFGASLPGMVSVLPLEVAASIDGMAGEHPCFLDPAPVPSALQGQCPGGFIAEWALQAPQCVAKYDVMSGGSLNAAVVNMSSEYGIRQMGMDRVECTQGKVDVQVTGEVASGEKKCGIEIPWYLRASVGSWLQSVPVELPDLATELSQEQLRSAVRGVLIESDLNTVSLKMVRREVEKGLDLPLGSLDSRAKEIQKIAVVAMRCMQLMALAAAPQQ